MKIYELHQDKKTNDLRLCIYSPKLCPDQIKTLIGASFNYSMGCYFAENIGSNKIILNNLGFEFIDENTKLKISQILISNNYISILADNKTRFIINKHFTYLEFIYNKFGNKLKKHEICILNNNEILVPIGLKDDLLYFLQTFDYTDLRLKRKFKFIDEEIKNSLEYIELYDNQIQIVKCMLNNTNGIIKSSTGSGKTECFLSYLKLTNLKTLILVNSIDLAKQTYNRCKKAGLEVGILQGENEKENYITIATIQSIHKLKDNYECVIVDECHQIFDSYNKILSNEKILYRFGFSATVFGKDKYKNITIKKFIGDIIYEIKSEMLIEENKIAEPLITFYNIDSSNYEQIFEWFNLEKLAIINNNIRNNKILEICQILKGQKLILIKKIEHGLLLEKLLNENNLNCKFLHGGLKKDEIEKVLKEFENNSNDFILIGSKILFTGIDLQNIHNLIFASAGNSYVEVIQSIGRGLRNKTKDTVNIFDFYDYGNKILEKHSNNRLKYLKDEGFKQIVVI
jgi:superfamily II DNA or RNA helicase